MADVNWDNGGDGTYWSHRFNWDGDQVPGDGDAAILTTGGGASNIIFDEDHSAGGRNIQLASVTLAGMVNVKHDENGNTHLRIKDGGDLGIAIGCKWQLGESLSAIDATHTAKVSFAPASNGNCEITASGTFKTQGTATWGRGAAAWETTIYDDGTGASAAEDHIHITDDLDIDPDKDILILIEQTDGTWNHFDLMQCSAYAADNGSWRVEFDYNEIDDGDTDLNYDHAVGARVLVVSRNVQVFSETAFGWTLNAATGSVTLAEAYFAGCYRNKLETTGDNVDHCAFRGAVGADTIFSSIGTDSDLFYWDDVLFFDVAYPFSNMSGINVCSNFHVQGCSYFAFTSIMQMCQISGGSINVRYTPLIPYRSSRFWADGVYFFSTGALNKGLFARLRNCVINTPNGVTELNYYGGITFLDNCLFSDSATLANTYQAYVVSRNHNRSAGAAKVWTQGSVLQKQSTVTYDSSDWALEASPGSLIGASNPLWVKVADIACKGGDTITVSARCRANAAYGTDNDPVLVLDRGDCNGVEAEQTFAVAAADTWYQATISDKTVTGDADDDLLVGLWLKVPHYASGASVFVDAVGVAGASAVSRGKLDYWPFEQVHAITGATRGKHGGKQ